MRSVEALELLNPKNLNKDAVDDLMHEYGGERFKGRLDKVVQLFPDPSEPIEPENYNDYRHTGAKTKADLGPLFQNFYFGCEADDKINAWAFNTKVNRFGMTLKAFFGSDIGHMDAPDFTRVDRGDLRTRRGRRPHARRVPACSLRTMPFYSTAG